MMRGVNRFKEDEGAYLSAIPNLGTILGDSRLYES